MRLTQASLVAKRLLHGQVLQARRAQRATFLIVHLEKGGLIFPGSSRRSFEETWHRHGLRINLIVPTIYKQNKTKHLVTVQPLAARLHLLPMAICKEKKLSANCPNIGQYVNWSNASFAVVLDVARSVVADNNDGKDAPVIHVTSMATLKKVALSLLSFFHKKNWRWLQPLGNQKILSSEVIPVPGY